MKNFFIGTFAIACFVLALFVVGYPSCWVISTKFCADPVGVMFQGLFTMTVVFVSLFVPWIIGVSITETE